MQNLNWYKQNIDLEKFALSSGCGFIRDRSSNKKNIKLYIPGRNSKKDTVIIITRDSLTNNQIYWNVTDFGFDKTFTIIDFVQHFILHNSTSNLDYKKIVGIIKERSSYIEVTPVESVEPTTKAQTTIEDLVINPFIDSHYLRQRKISLTTSKLPVFNGSIYSVKSKNPKKTQYINTGFAFKSLDGKIKSILIRYFIGQNSFSQFIGDKSNSIWYSERTSGATKLIITESPEDALSYCELHPEEVNQSVYCATGGEISQTQLELLYTLGTSANINQLYLAFDNDQQGLIYRLKTFLYLQNKNSTIPVITWSRQKEIFIMQITKEHYRPIHSVQTEEFEGKITVKLNLSLDIIKTQIELLFKTYHLPNLTVINIYSVSKDFNQDLINQTKTI